MVRIGVSRARRGQSGTSSNGVYLGLESGISNTEAAVATIVMYYTLLGGPGRKMARAGCPKDGKR